MVNGWAVHICPRARRHSLARNREEEELMDPTVRLERLIDHASVDNALLQLRHVISAEDDCVAIQI
ncbi:hypothetical protein MUK42_36269 [Musa troglodytarum]|uniref:Uncharacterized protein n=1 Tax=Musa troglodytarum TaxID=320322 RepID=A0A9E7J8S9_9LILI|nr:hypothetical protein MUK42_36269 [Musa troglodytarum]